MKTVIASITVCILLLILSGCQDVEPYTRSMSFTAPEWADYKAQHPDASEEYMTSHYYYVFLGKDKADTGVCVFMNKDVFTKDDIFEMARSVQF